MREDNIINFGNVHQLKFQIGKGLVDLNYAALFACILNEDLTVDDALSIFHLLERKEVTLDEKE